MSEKKTLSKAANDIYEQLTDFVHKGYNSLGKVAGIPVESIALDKSNVIEIELEDGHKISCAVSLSR